MQLRRKWNDRSSRTQLINGNMMIAFGEDGKANRVFPVGLSYTGEDPQTSEPYFHRVNIIMSGIAKSCNQTKGCGSAISSRTGRFVTQQGNKDSVGSRITDDLMQCIDKWTAIAGGFYPTRLLEVATANVEIEGGTPTKASSRAQCRSLTDVAKNIVSPQKLDWDGDTQVDSEALTAPSSADENEGEEKSKRKGTGKSKAHRPVKKTTTIEQIKDKFEMFRAVPLTFQCPLPSIRTSHGKMYHKVVQFASSLCFLADSLRSIICTYDQSVGHADNHQTGYTFFHTFDVNPFDLSSGTALETGLAKIKAFSENILKSMMRTYCDFEKVSTQCLPVCISWHVRLSDYVFLTFPRPCLFCRFHSAWFSIWNTLRSKTR